jgi:hypothetical protein
VFSVQILQKNTFLEIKLNFSLTGKCFPLINFSNVKQTQESLESGFPENEFRETNIALDMFVFFKNIFKYFYFKLIFFGVFISF